jgi:hypothetical protein
MNHYAEEELKQYNHLDQLYDTRKNVLVNPTYEQSHSSKYPAPPSYEKLSKQLRHRPLPKTPSNDSSSGHYSPPSSYTSKRSAKVKNHKQTHSQISSPSSYSQSSSSHYSSPPSYSPQQHSVMESSEKYSSRGGDPSLYSYGNYGGSNQYYSSPSDTSQQYGFPEQSRVSRYHGPVQQKPTGFRIKEDTYTYEGSKKKLKSSKVYTVNQEDQTNLRSNLLNQYIDNNDRRDYYNNGLKSLDEEYSRKRLQLESQNIYWKIYQKTRKN